MSHDDAPDLDPNASPEEVMAAWTARRRAIDLDLRRTIFGWAGAHENCPLAGCRRHKACQRLDDCQGVSREPITEEEWDQIRREVRAALDKRFGRETASVPEEPAPPARKRRRRAPR